MPTRPSSLLPLALTPLTLALAVSCGVETTETLPVTISTEVPAETEDPAETPDPAPGLTPEADATPEEDPAPTPITPAALDFELATIDGGMLHLGDEYGGKVLVVVNVASKCGYTPQYKDLQELHTRYAEKGLAILAFPCNQFGGQEPWEGERIREFCESTYGVEFDVFAKIEVNGDGQSPLYDFLTDAEKNPAAPEDGKIAWNFEKFVIARDGEVLAHFRSKTNPTDDAMIEVIEGAL